MLVLGDVLFPKNGAMWAWAGKGKIGGRKLVRLKFIVECKMEG